MGRRLPFDILPQPDDVTCGPTCLHAVYAYYGDHLPLTTVIDEVETLATKGTLAVLLACHALRRGYRATIYTYHLDVFDPSWFTGEVDLAEKLRAQARAKSGPRLRFATERYLEFLELGGTIRHRELGPDLIRKQLKRGRPILTGLSATYLYDCPREIDLDGNVMAYDDVAGVPSGHFVVVHGYDMKRREVTVADPLHENPRGTHTYEVQIQRLLGAILLGVLTYDGNLLVLVPPTEATA